MSFRLQIQWLTCVVLCATAGMAHAYECGVKSPRLLALGDDAYYEGTSVSESNSESISAVPIEVQSNLILATIDRARFKSGTGVRYKCSGLKGDTSVQRSEFRLRDISVNQQDEEIILKAFEDHRKSLTAKSARLFISLLEHEVDIISDNELTAHSRQRQFNNRTRFSFFRESELKAVRDDSRITLTQTFWINGELVETTVWQLDS